MRRFYFEIENLKSDKIFLFKEEFFHLKNVLRMNVGDTVACFCGDGKDYICEIEEIEKDVAVLLVKQVVTAITTPKVDVTVFQGTLKLDKFDLVIQKLAELGIKKVVPFESAFSVVKLKQEKIERYKKISLSASKQCQRADFMEVGNKLSFKEMLKVLKEFDKVIFAYEKEEEALLKNVNFNADKKIAIVVGSEGGFNLQEVESLEKLENLTTVTLGKRILRAETAVITLSGLTMFLLGEI